MPKNTRSKKKDLLKYKVAKKIKKEETRRRTRQDMEPQCQIVEDRVSVWTGTDQKTGDTCD